MVGPPVRDGKLDEIKAYLRFVLSEGSKLVLSIRYEHAVLINHFLEDTVRVPPPHWELVRPMESDEAAQVIADCITLDKLPLAAGLSDQIAADLAHDGFVWPVELQIVLYELSQEPTWEEYDTRGRASGILSDFVRNTIVRAPDPTPTRDLLRALTSSKGATAVIGTGLPAFTFDSLLGVLAGIGCTPETLERALDYLSQHRIVGQQKYDVNAKGQPAYRLNHDYLRTVVLKAIEAPLSVEDAATNLAQTYLLQQQSVENFEPPIGGLKHAARFGHADVVQSHAFREMYRRAMRRNLQRTIIPPASAFVFAIILLGIASYEVSWEESRISPEFDKRYSMQGVQFGFAGPTAMGAPDPVHSRVLAFAGATTAIWTFDGKSVAQLDVGDSAPDYNMPRSESPWIIFRDSERYTFAIDTTTGTKVNFPADLPVFDEATRQYSYVFLDAAKGRFVFARHACSEGTLHISVVVPGKDMRVVDSRRFLHPCGQIPDAANPQRPVQAASNLQIFWAPDSSAFVVDIYSPANAYQLTIAPDGKLGLADVPLYASARELLVGLSSVDPQILAFFRPAPDVERYYVPQQGGPVVTTAIAGVGEGIFVESKPDRLYFAKVKDNLLSIYTLSVTTGDVGRVFHASVTSLFPKCTDVPTSAGIAEVDGDAFVLLVGCKDERARSVNRAFLRVEAGKGRTAIVALERRDKIVQTVPLFEPLSRRWINNWYLELGGNAVYLNDRLKRVPVPYGRLADLGDRRLAYVHSDSFFSLDTRSGDITRLAQGVGDGWVAPSVTGTSAYLARSDGRTKIYDARQQLIIDGPKYGTGELNRYYPCGASLAWMTDGSVSRYVRVIKIFGISVWPAHSCASG